MDCDAPGVKGSQRADCAAYPRAIRYRHPIEGGEPMHDHPPHDLDRRDFLKAGAAGTVAALSAVTPLSEQSVAKKGAPMAFPDFMKGRWKSARPLHVMER
jgi:hypothetical protein